MQLNAIYSLPPELSKIEDKEENYAARKAIYKKHLEVISRLNYAFTLLEHTSWWIGWRASMISLPKVVYGDEIKTAAVSLDPNSGSIQLWFNGNWAANLSSGDLAFVYAHETLHAVFDHLSRRKSLPKLWNIVCDAFINEYLHRYLKWNEGVEHKDRLDFVLKDGIRWNHYTVDAQGNPCGGLPKSVTDKYPVENMNQYSADQIYFACLEDMKDKGVDTRIFQLGKMVRKKKPKDPNAPPPGKPIRQTVSVQIGDIVRVKSQNEVGRIKDITKDHKGRVTNVKVETLTPDELKQLMLKPAPGTTKGPNAR